MRYLRVKWVHSSPRDPVEIFSEIDASGYEVRKVEIFPDGNVGFADSKETYCSTELGEKPIPSVEDIAADPQFQPVLISGEEFEKIWAKRFSSASHS
jgi:hypothetical protein